MRVCMCMYCRLGRVYLHLFMCMYVDILWNIIEKQDKLLFVAFYILLNLAEDPAVEKKMVKKDLIVYLQSILTHKNCDLLVLGVTFLRKLSIIDENKDTIKNMNIISNLVRFIPCPSQALTVNVLRLLFNLSYDKVNITCV